MSHTIAVLHHRRKSGLAMQVPPSAHAPSSSATDPSQRHVQGPTRATRCIPGFLDILQLVSDSPIHLPSSLQASTVTTEAIKHCTSSRTVPFHLLFSLAVVTCAPTKLVPIARDVFLWIGCGGMRISNVLAKAYVPWSQQTPPTVFTRLLTRQHRIHT